MAKLLVSHTHDAAVMAARIHAHLAARHGDEQVYGDVADIPAGQGGPGTAGRVAEVDAVVAVVDRGWLDAEGPDPGVAAELAPALRRGQPVVPVLVDGAVMPEAAALPPALRSLTTRPAVAVHAATFDADAARLDAELARLGLGSRAAAAAPPPATRPRAVAILVAIALLILGIVIALVAASGPDATGWAPL